MKTSSTSSRRSLYGIRTTLFHVAILSLALLSTACTDYFGPSKTEREARKQAYLADHNLLRLQLAKCEQFKANIDQPGA